MPDGEAILIAAQSGRALAQAARRAGLRPFVLDLFGDEDTLALAEAHRRLPGRFGAGRRRAQTVLAGLAALSDRVGGKPFGVVLGSGFEGAPDLIAQIAARHRLTGAEAATVAMLKDPTAFAALCERLSIPHPDVRLPGHGTSNPHPHPEVPRSGLEGGLQGSRRLLEGSFEARLRLAPQEEDAGGMSGVGRTRDWLLKRIGGSGGGHIRPARSRLPSGHYRQARVPGRAFALNFLADGRDLSVLAFTEQWSAPSNSQPFRFAGVIAPGREEQARLSKSVRETVSNTVAELVAATGLRGLASADILVDGSNWWLLEINPRPGASLDALDRRPTPLLAGHIEASLGRLPRLDLPPTDAAGSEICYAPRRYACMQPVDWPDFVRDRPLAGSRVAQDSPLCTVTAAGPDSRAVRETLRERSRALGALLENREDQNGNRDTDSERQRPGDAARRATRR